MEWLGRIVENRIFQIFACALTTTALVYSLQADWGTSDKGVRNLLAWSAILLGFVTVWLGVYLFRALRKQDPFSAKTFIEGISFGVAFLLIFMPFATGIMMAFAVGAGLVLAAIFWVWEFLSQFPILRMIEFVLILVILGYAIGNSRRLERIERQLSDGK